MTIVSASLPLCLFAVLMGSRMAMSARQVALVLQLRALVNVLAPKHAQHAQETILQFAAMMAARTGTSVWHVSAHVLELPAMASAHVPRSAKRALENIPLCAVPMVARMVTSA